MPGQSLELLRSCFFEPAPALRDRLAALDAPARSALYGGLGSLIRALLSACHYREGAFIEHPDSQLGAMRQYTPRIASAAALWPGLEAHYDQAEDWLLREDISLYAARDAGRLSLMLQMLQVGLAPQAQVPAGFRLDQARIPYYHAEQSDASWAYNLGRVLLDRPEAWRFELLQSFCAGIAALPSPLGYARLMRELLARHPEQRDAFAPWIGESMALDGFADPEPEAYPAEMLLAGLKQLARPAGTGSARPAGTGSARPAAAAGTESGSEPLAGLELDQNFMARVIYPRIARGELARRDLIELSFAGLQGARQQALLEPWLSLLEHLSQNGPDLPAEPGGDPGAAAELQAGWIRLLRAPGRAAGLAALRWLRPCLLAGELDSQAEALLAGALQALRGSAGRARAGWQLLLALASRPGQAEQVLTGLGQALPIKHPCLQLEVLSWLREQARPLPAGLREALLRLGGRPDLSPLEYDALRELLPGQALNEPVPVSLPPGPGRVPPWREAYAAAIRAASDSGAGLEGLAAILPPDAERWDPPLPGFNGRDEVAGALLRGLEAGVNCRDFERLLAGVLAWPAQDIERLRGRLAPVYELLARWQAPASDEQLLALPPRSLHLVLLAHGWLEQGRRPAFSEASARISAIQLGTPTAYCQMLQVEGALRALALGQPCLLATPTSLGGWLEPEAFAGRLACLAAGGLDDEDLGLALLRLPARDRPACWAQLAPLLPGLPPHQAAALQLALGPPELAAAGLERFVAYFAGHPPDDWLLQLRFYTVQPRDTEPNRRFRLCNRAVLARTGLGDARAALPGLARLNQDQLLANAGLDHSLLNQTAGRLIDGIRRFLSRAAELPAAMAQPEPQQKMLNLAHSPVGRTVLEAFWHPGAQLPHPFETDPSLRHLLAAHALPYPQMAAHVIAWLGPLYQPGCGAAFDPDEFVLPLGWYMPILAARLWQAALSSLRGLTAEALPIDPHLFAAALIGYGASPWVAIGPDDLGALQPLLSSPYRPQREALLKLLERLLADGRATPLQVAGFWAEALASGDSFKAVQAAATAWAARHPACELLLLAALERLWDAGRQPEPRRLRRLLERFLSLLPRHHLAVTRPSAREALTALASGQRSAAPLARLLLSASGGPIDQRLLELLPSLLAKRSPDLA